MLKTYSKDILIFLLLFIILSIISVFIVQCPDWDFYNYHYYNGYAFLNDRIGTDFLPANFRTYINPYYESFLYFLMTKLNNHPYVFLSITSLDNALFLFLIYKITDFIIVEPNKIIKSIIILLSLGYIAFTPIMIDGYNYSMNDIAVGNFVLISLYLLLKNLFIDLPKRNLWIFISGISLGIALALKLTCLVYCFTIVFCIFILMKKIPNWFKTLMLFVAGVMISFIILDGYYMYNLYKLYDNPLFPYFNNIFKSKYYADIDMAHFEYLGILPANLKELIFYPFYYTAENHIWGNYRLNIDFRYAITFISAILLGIYMFITRKNDSDKFLNVIKKEHLYFLLLLVIVSYYCNQSLSGVYRFIISTSALYGIIAYIVCELLCKIVRINNKMFCIIVFICLTIFAYCTSTYSYYSIKVPEKNNKLFYNDEKYNIEDNAKVLLLNAETSYFVSGQNKKAQYYGFAIPTHIFEKYNDFLKDKTGLTYYSIFTFSEYLENELKKMLSDNNNKIYVIYNQNNYFENIYKEALDFYSSETREMGNCREIGYKGIVYFRYNKVYLCEFNLK